MLPPQLSPVRLRLAALTPRERGFVAAGLIAVLVFALYLLLRGDAEPEMPPPPPIITPAPPQIVAPAPVVAVVPPPPALPPLVLHGVFAGGPGGGAAVFASGGGQRLVRIGRPVAPGVVLTGVGRDHVLLDVGGAPMRLAFGRAVEPAAAPAMPAQAAAPAGSSTTDYRLGLRPAAPGGSAGYVVKPDARLPLLAAAGLQPGDVIVSVNGSAFDEERLLDLSWQAANSDRITFEYLRNGRKMSGTVERP